LDAFEPQTTHYQHDFPCFLEITGAYSFGSSYSHAVWNIVQCCAGYDTTKVPFDLLVWVLPVSLYVACLKHEIPQGLAKNLADLLRNKVL
jgi:hypothetical protein